MSDNPFGILTDETVPASRLRADQVVTAGRARVRRRRTTAVGVCAALVVLVTIAGVAAAARAPRREPARPVPVPSPSVIRDPSGCTVSRVEVDPELGYAYTDPTGRYVAFSRYTDPLRLVVTLDGALTGDFRPADGHFRAVGVNASGVVIASGGEGHSIAYHTSGDATLVELPRPAGALGVRPTGINAAGDIVGEATMPGKRFRAVLWRHTDLGRAVLLATPSGRMSTANAIGDDGRIVGSLDDGAEPYLWRPDGTGTTLPTPRDLPGGMVIQINGDWAVGLVNYLSITTFDPSSGRRSGPGRPAMARWNLRTGVVVSLDVSDVVFGSGGITRDGTIMLNRIDGAVLWRDGQMTSLPAPEHYGKVQTLSTSVDGRVIIGSATSNSGGSSEPFRWDCTP